MRVGVNVGHIYLLPRIEEWMPLLRGFHSIRWLNALRTNMVWWEANQPDSFVPRSMLELPDHDEFEHVDIWRTGKGIAPSKCVELSNNLGADCWLTVPHRFNSREMHDYAVSLAPYVQKNRILRVELGGEIFNSNFMHRHEYEAAGLRTKVASDGYRAALITHANHTRQLSNAFMLAGISARIVLSGHSTNTWMMEYMLGETGIGQYIDSISIAPYVGVGARDKWDMYQGLWDAGSRVESYRRIADQYGLDLDVYECGQHLITGNAPDLNRSDWMGDWILDYLRVMETSGVDDAHIYSAWGGYKEGEAWGLNEIVDGDIVPTPKLTAVRRFMRL